MGGFSGWGGLSRILEDAKQREQVEERSRRNESRLSPRERALQGPSQRIERPSFAQPRNDMARIEEPQQIDRSPAQVSAPPSWQESSRQRNEPRRYNTTQTDNPPPLPYTMPAVTPVGDLKNRTAIYNQYTPEAARELYNTPVRAKIGYTPGDPWLGGYASGNISTTIQPDQEESQGTLAHEFAHKWHEQRLSPELKSSWANTAEDVVNWYASDLNSSHPHGNENELYAYNAQRGPSYMNPQVRDFYYPGLYRDEIRPPNPPVPEWERYALQSDELPPMSPDDRYADEAWQVEERRTRFNPSHWVNEYEAPLGYFEDGGAVRNRLPYPSQWSPPQFPSMSEYIRSTPEWMWASENGLPG
jgi:hypothetical protein